MERVLFIHSDIRQVIFRNIDWVKDFRIIDEKLFLLQLNEEEYNDIINKLKQYYNKCINKLRKRLERIDKDSDKTRVRIINYRDVDLT